MAKISAPNKEYTGISAGVPFVNGAGESEDPRLLAWFREHGYQVEETGEKFVCPHCAKEYKTAEGLEKHIAKEHEAEESKE